ncbi:MAG: hypothetical protein SCARUB_00292 [Candidatus Scalindua rubra]|uniref:Uncharacterized protein n=1 Tax=Candidatus Scalindua rubra TaxID=1872076 RepID=A0A1E3XG00_9BACT|nr:MAG: hypothetical protein SCARUB_00292 [Candidatus Scalindua rubra]
MIVLDEQLLGRNIEVEIAKWYRGAVQFISDLRPNTVIKDDAIPELLRQQNQPSFVTINETDFWRKVTIDKRYFIICFVLSDSRAGEIPHSLRSLLRRSEFNTKAKRMGKVTRVKSEEIDYYTFDDRSVRTISLLD